METRRAVFQAIADPTRREIIDLLAHELMNLNTIAEHFDITAPPSQIRFRERHFFLRVFSSLVVEISVMCVV